MMRWVVRTAVVPILASAALVASDFWDDKDPTAWSDDQAERLLTDSPWAQTAVVMSADFSLANRVGGLSGGVVGRGVGSRGAFGGSGGGVGGDGAGNLGGGSFLASPDRIRVAVRWSSARPVKLALARLRSLGKLPTDTPIRAEEAEEEPFYRISVSGLPPQAYTTISELTAVTVLKRQNATSLDPTSVHFEYEGDLLTIDYLFSKADPVTIADREVEFVTKVGESAIKKKFRPRDMVFQSKLAL
jgi:hypothetical protein